MLRVHMYVQLILSMKLLIPQCVIGLQMKVNVTNAVYKLAHPMIIDFVISNILVIVDISYSLNSYHIILFTDTMNLVSDKTCKFN